MKPPRFEVGDIVIYHESESQKYEIVDVDFYAPYTTKCNVEYVYKIKPLDGSSIHREWYAEGHFTPEETPSVPQETLLSDLEDLVKKYRE